MYSAGPTDRFASFAVGSSSYGLETFSGKIAFTPDAVISSKSFAISDALGSAVAFVTEPSAVPDGANGEHSDC